MGLLLNLGHLVTTWYLWLMVLLETPLDGFESIIHGYMFCIFPKTTAGVLCSLHNEYFIFRCGSPLREGVCGEGG